jgi:hypothetical protein
MQSCGVTTIVLDQGERWGVVVNGVRNRSNDLRHRIPSPLNLFFGQDSLSLSMQRITKYSGTCILDDELP